MLRQISDVIPDTPEASVKPHKWAHNWNAANKRQIPKSQANSYQKPSQQNIYSEPEIRRSTLDTPHDSILQLSIPDTPDADYSHSRKQETTKISFELQNNERETKHRQGSPVHHYLQPSHSKSQLQHGISEGKVLAEKGKEFRPANSEKPLNDPETLDTQDESLIICSTAISDDSSRMINKTNRQNSLQEMHSQQPATQNFLTQLKDLKAASLKRNPPESASQAKLVENTDSIGRHPCQNELLFEFDLGLDPIDNTDNIAPHDTELCNLENSTQPQFYKRHSAGQTADSSIVSAKKHRVSSQFVWQNEPADPDPTGPDIQNAKADTKATDRNVGQAKTSLISAERDMLSTSHPVSPPQRQDNASKQFDLTFVPPDEQNTQARPFSAPTLSGYEGAHPQHCSKGSVKGTDTFGTAAPCRPEPKHQAEIQIETANTKMESVQSIQEHTSHSKQGAAVGLEHPKTMPAQRDKLLMDNAKDTALEQNKGTEASAAQIATNTVTQQVNVASLSTIQDVKQAAPQVKGDGSGFRRVNRLVAPPKREVDTFTFIFYLCLQYPMREHLLSSIL